MPDSEPTSAARRPLRVGILLDSLTAPAWVAQIIESIENGGAGRISAVVLNAAPPQPRSFWQRLRQAFPRLLYTRYERLDARVFRAAKDAFAPRDLSSLLNAVPRIEVVPIGKRFVQRFSPEDARRVREADLDVILRFGFRIIKGEILGAARYGVWSYHHGDNRQYRGGPPLFWEVAEGNPVSGTMLQVLTEELDAGRVIARSSFATNPISLYRNRNQTYWETSEMIPRCLARLHAEGPAFLNGEAQAAGKPIPLGPIYRAPGNLRMVGFFAQILTRRFMQHWNGYFFREVWFVAYRRRRAGLPAPGAMDGFQVMVPPAGTFEADPCVIEQGGAAHLFFEQFDIAESKGRIAHVSLDAQGGRTETRVVLSRDYHLSYPFLFEWRGGAYMIPETMDNGTIELYEAEEFPSRWRLAATLMQGVRAVDTTLFEREGRWWLFTNLDSHGYPPNRELHIFSSDSPLGIWTPHPRNPVVSDVRSARGGGHIIFENGRLIRPAQDCSRSYGCALVLNEIETLNLAEYRERVIDRIGPEWIRRGVGAHTFNRSENWEVVDGRARVRKRPGWLAGQPSTIRARSGIDSST